MADRRSSRFPGLGPAEAALGPPPGGGLLPSRSSPLRRGLALPAIAANDQMHPGVRRVGLEAMVVRLWDMKFEPMWLWALGLTIALTVTGSLLWRHRASVAERRQRPALLRDAELICVESQFRSKGRWPIVARVDRAYRLPSGLVVLVELKTRSTAAVRGSDVIQLSAQRMAVEDNLRSPVSDVGFVLIPGLTDRDPAVARSVRLMNREQVEALVLRRHRLLRGVVHPSWPHSDQVCQGCGHLEACRLAGQTLVAGRRSR